MVKGIKIQPSAFLLIVLLISMSNSVLAQLKVTDNVSAGVLVQTEIVGNEGIATRNISFKGNPDALAFFENGENSGLGIDQGIILSTGDALGVKGPNSEGGYTSGTGGEGSALLEQFIPYKTLDAATLQFDFKPQTDRIVFNYVFSSEEYIEWVDSGFNDIFGFFISGPGITGEQNVALVPDTNIEVTIDHINHLRNSEYFVHNTDTTSDAYKYLQQDGQTVTLQAVLDVTPCEWYTIKMAIADVGDPDKDSWVFIESKSFKHETNLVNDTSFCTDDFQIVLDAGNPNFDVRWNTGDTTQKIVADTFGLYSVEVFTGCGSFKDEVSITPKIFPLDLGPDTAVCGDEIETVIEVFNKGYETYDWHDFSNDSSFSVWDTGLVWLEVTANDCIARDSIYFRGKPIPSFDLGRDTVICGEVNIALNPRRSADSRLWSTGDTTRFITATSPGMFSLSLTLDGCSFTDSIQIDTAKWPVVDISPKDLTVCGEDSVLLNSGVTDPIAFDILWSTGENTPTIKVYDAQMYSVTVRDRICDYSVSDDVELVRLQSIGDYSVPNAFTPNGDDLNDKFRALQSWSYYIEFNMVIANRWGEVVFETDDPLISWDGKANGVPAEPGIYMFQIIVKTPCGQERVQTKSGMLHLIR